MIARKLFNSYVVVNPNCDYVSRVIDDILLENNGEIGIARFSFEMSRRVKVQVPPGSSSEIIDGNPKEFKITDGTTSPGIYPFELVTEAESWYAIYRKLNYSFYRLEDGIVRKEK